MSDHLRVLPGSVTDDGSALANAMHGQDVVISALGVGKSFKLRGLIAESVPRIVRAMLTQIEDTTYVRKRVLISS